MTSTRVYLGLGSNVQANKNLPLALSSLEELGVIIASSKVYRSKAIGIEGEDFLNAVVCIETSYSLDDFYQRTKQIEQRHCSPNGLRVFDIDVLLFDDKIQSQTPQLPRKDIFEYPFVLYPLFEIAPNLEVPSSDGIQSIEVILKGLIGRLAQDALEQNSLEQSNLEQKRLAKNKRLQSAELDRLKPEDLGLFEVEHLKSKGF